MRFPPPTARIPPGVLRPHDSLGVRAARLAATSSPAAPRFFLREPRLATPAHAIPGAVGARAARRAAAPAPAGPRDSLLVEPCLATLARAIHGAAGARAARRAAAPAPAGPRDCPGWACSTLVKNSISFSSVLSPRLLSSLSVPLPAAMRRRVAPPLQVFVGRFAGRQGSKTHRHVVPNFRWLIQSTLNVLMGGYMFLEVGYDRPVKQ
ncbi:uncharacterized protein LOC120711841 [Panicum virgatum]|uniref:uncharacterized protein LOC120711841 n=1 Tax=Panicum virgatum TaxID=38727 RepID=UPI0019D58753|nr:uncharacterized protein LOC120711841 [Panicum virgatum]